eukprot:m.181843 g.181843  ORF g.181843 m.181843 type:complete len:66 (-) comp16875_c0_seq6:2764-2961(-)
MKWTNLFQCGCMLLPTIKAACESHVQAGLEDHLQVSLPYDLHLKWTLLDGYLLPLQTRKATKRPH